MDTGPLTGIRACVFDAYGTLFDVASAANRCRDALGDKLERFNALWREKQLQYTWLRASQGRHADFWQVTGDALDFALEALGIGNDDALRARLMELYVTLDAYPDARDALRAIKDRGFATAILSNGAPRMLAAAVDSAGIGALLDAVLSVEDVGVFKPHPSVYELLVARFGVPSAQILFVTSNGWDAWAASAYGLKVAWCNRTGAPRERLPGAPDRVIGSLAELPGLLPAAA
jgi:2-haloacid dehalogenase